MLPCEARQGRPAIVRAAALTSMLLALSFGALADSTITCNIGRDFYGSSIAAANGLWLNGVFDTRNALGGTPAEAATEIVVDPSVPATAAQNRTARDLPGIYSLDSVVLPADLESPAWRLQLATGAEGNWAHVGIGWHLGAAIYTSTFSGSLMDLAGPARRAAPAGAAKTSSGAARSEGLPVGPSNAVLFSSGAFCLVLSKVLRSRPIDQSPSRPTRWD